MVCVCEKIEVVKAGNKSPIVVVSVVVVVVSASFGRVYN